MNTVMNKKQFVYLFVILSSCKETVYDQRDNSNVIKKGLHITYVDLDTLSLCDYNLLNKYYVITM